MLLCCAVVLYKFTFTFGDLYCAVKQKMKVVVAVIIVVVVVHVVVLDVVV